MGKKDKAAAVAKSDESPNLPPPAAKDPEKPSETKMVNPPATDKKLVKVRVLRSFRVPGNPQAIEGQVIELPEETVKELEKPFIGPYCHAGSVDKKNVRRHMIRRVERVL